MFQTSCVHHQEADGRLSSSINTVRTGDADLRFYITTVQDG